MKFSFSFFRKWPQQESTRHQLPRGATANWRHMALFTALLFLGNKEAFYAKESLREAPLFPLENIRPGMRGLTYTVLQGTRIVPLQTEILGVAKNALGPQMDMIIGKLVDPKTRETGAVHGMSGSPLYLRNAEGQLCLAGALSRRIAVFEKDGHCGFTPMKDMLAVSKHLEQEIAQTPHRPTPFPWAVRSAALQAKNTWEHHQFEPLAIPLALAGVDPKWWNALAKPLAFPQPHWLATAGGGSQPTLDLGPEDLQPGAAVSAVLMTGDVSLAGTGTLTWRQGNQILGFGHPMFGFGKSNLPMATAEIITTVPSYFRPFKMSNVGKIVGTISQDRWSAIGGRIGPSPSMGTYRIERTHQGQKRPPIAGTFFAHETLTPLLLSTAILGALVGHDDISRIFEIKTKGEIRFAHQPPLKLEGFYAGEDLDLFSTLAEIMAPLAELYQQKEALVEATALELSLETNEKPAQFLIEKIMTDRTEVEPGATLPIYVELKKLYGAREIQTLSLTLPENLREGTLMLRVASANALNNNNTQQLLKAARTPEEKIHAYNQRRLQNHFYLQVLTSAAGKIIHDQEMPALPDSVLHIMQGGNSSTQPHPLQEQVWLEKSKELPGTVQGMQTLTIQLQ